MAKLPSGQQHVTVLYGTECTAFGFATVHISEATYLFTAKTGQNVHLLNTISITPTFFGTSICTVTVGPQTLSTVDYANVGTTKMTVNATVTGIHYTVHGGGGSCGSVGTFSNGTYVGASVIERVGGGSFQYDHGT
jgi:formyltetrahydrofolate synthetase